MPTLLTPTPRTPHQRTQQNLRGASPSYFGLAVDPDKTTGHSTGVRGAKAAFSPLNTSIRSVAATPPQSVSLQGNADYEAFRRRSEQNSFNLSTGSVSQLASPPLARQHSRPMVSRTASRQAPTSPAPVLLSSVTQKVDSESLRLTNSETPRLSKSPKRMLSSDSQTLFEDRPRRASPASFMDHDSDVSNGSPPSKNEEKHARLTLPFGPKLNPQSLVHHRAETLPPKFEASEGSSPSLVSSQHVLTLLESHEDEVLLLDLRVSTQYARSHINGALNLCVPTTLLKRPSYNVDKLADTFKDEEQREKFERWESCKCIVVYDANSSHIKEAAICVNILKKFTSEGWDGDSYIIRGGFADFAKKFHGKVVQGDGSANSSPIPGLNLKLDVPPVIGGCPMPATKNAANPFFGNIRQNMDLIGGVGQMSIKCPSSMKQKQDYEIPTWLQHAATEEDNGKTVAEKFLRIEKREQKRMQEALSGHVTYGTPGPTAHSRIQIAGIEKGAKNRYNNIWPYEHSRVKLSDVPASGCDYINASHLSTSLSRKRYITTQAPIPATFNDFWKMVWQSDARVVVMLTAEAEGGQVKAHNYWSEKQYGPLRLKLLSEDRASLELSKIKRHRKRPSVGDGRSTNSGANPFRSSYNSNNGNGNGNSFEFFASKPDVAAGNDVPFVTVRRFTLSHEGQPFERMREITQLQYSNWPDFGAPAHPTHLLGLVEQCAAVVGSNRANSFKGSMDTADEPQRPVLVHCSAGCGRTGTFCTVDTVVDLLTQQRRARETKRQNGEQKPNQDPTPMDVDGHDSTTVQKPAGGGTDFFTQGRDGGEEQLQRDAAEDWLYRDNVDLIERVVEDFRLQRVSMVQSLRQYCLTYEAVLEWVIAQQEQDADDE